MMTSRITLGQTAQIITLAQAALQKTIVLGLESLQLNGEEAQRIIENGGSFQKYFQEPTLRGLRQLYLPPAFMNEEVESNFGYDQNHRAVSIKEQVNILRKVFPKIDLMHLALLDGINRNDTTLPNHADEKGWFVLPHWTMLDESYNGAVVKILQALKYDRDGRFSDFLDKRMGVEHLRETDRKRDMMEEYVARQGTLLLIIPAQFGIYHRGRSGRRVRGILSSDEFGLGIYEVAIMLLTHKMRLCNKNSLFIDTIGDEYSPEPNGSFDSHTLNLRFDDSVIQLGHERLNAPDAQYGSVTAFLT